MKTYIKPALSVTNVTIEHTILTGSSPSVNDQKGNCVHLAPGYYDPFFDDEDDF